MNELIIPPLAQEDPNSFELLRVWAANGEQHCTIHSELQGDESDFGYMLADLVIHGSNLYSERFGRPIEVIKKRMLDALIQELKEGTDERSGGIID